MKHANPIRIAKIALLACAAILTFATGCFDHSKQTKKSPSLVPAVIEGDSMAPFVVGQHLNVTCPQCRLEFQTESITKQTTLTCPNCCCSTISTESAELFPSDEVTLNPAIQMPQRWDVVGFKLNEQNAYGIKRVVGLPGESIEIKRGDLIADGILLRKSIETQRALRIPVFDSAHSAPEPFGLTHRLIPESANSVWTIDDSHFRFSTPKSRQPENQESLSGEFDRLAYQHWRGFSHRHERDQRFPIEDSYGFNQTSNRDVNQVDDLYIEWEVEFDGRPTDIQWIYRRGEVINTFSLVWDDNSWRFEIDDRANQRANCKTLTYLKSFRPTVASRLRIELSSFDHSISVMLDGDLIYHQLDDNADPSDAEAASAPANPVRPVIWFGAKTNTANDTHSVAIKRFRIWRDIHYLDQPAGYGSRLRELHAGPNQLILLGDNSPRSLDSRTWDSPGLDLEKIIGVVETINSQ